MANPLFARILPKEAADLGQLVEYTGKVGDFERLVEIVAADMVAASGSDRQRNWRAMPVAIRLEFRWADGMQGVPAVVGRAAGQIPAICQRCLKAFDLLLDTSIDMLLVAPAESASVDGHEVWELDDDAVRLVDVVEESLVMAMPLAPTHEIGEQCMALDAEDTNSGSETVRPFADLRSQLEKTNN